MVELKEKEKEIQCKACQSLIVVDKFNSEKLVSINRIPQIQMLRQIKIKKSYLANYELVPVC
jgi:hypothetical protein